MRCLVHTVRRNLLRPDGEKSPRAEPAPAQQDELELGADRIARGERRVDLGPTSRHAGRSSRGRSQLPRQRVSYLWGRPAAGRLVARPPRRCAWPTLAARRAQKGW